MLPPDFKILKELGRGSNNRVYKVIWKKEVRIFRTPRRKSDTQQFHSAKWEYIHTARASDLKVAPKLHDAWYSRHADDKWSSGLFMVMDYYPDDVEDLYLNEKKRATFAARSTDISHRLVSHLQTLADNDILVYDLKPANIVLKLDDDVDVRIIDYGRDFCEYRHRDEIDVNTPVIDMVDRLCKGDGALRKHLLFATMLVQLSATTTRHIYGDRRNHRMAKEERRNMNPLNAVTNKFLDSMQATNIALLRIILRHNEVKGVLVHYHGRRNAGTGRTLRFAVGTVC